DGGGGSGGGGGRRGVGIGGGDGCDTPAGEEGAGGRRASSRSKAGRLPSPLWPSCGVRSLAVWQRAWASRGLQHPGHDGLRGDSSSVLEETLCGVVREQRATIDALRRQVAGGRGE
ncbi:unnamed protein product, partial [Scytosiphon promiscuus]